MELTERDLRNRVRDVDDLHRDGMATMSSDLQDLHAISRTEVGRSRRSLLASAAATGAVITIGSLVLPIERALPAFAQAAAALDDPTIAAFAASVEYAAVAAYHAAAASGKVTTPAVAQAAALFASHHKEHGDAFLSAANGKWKTDQSNPLLIQALSDQLDKAESEKEVVKLAYDTENAAAATYIFALGALKNADALKLTASILPVESAHAVVLGGVLGMALPAGAVQDPTPSTYMPTYETQKLALSPTAYPIAGGTQ